jgi:hypothetical protein
MVSLFRYGFFEESERLKELVLRLISEADPGGIHETYNPLTGTVGWGSGSSIAGFVGSPGEPSAFQFGWSSSLTMQILLDRHQAYRYLMPGEINVRGYIMEARPLHEEYVFYMAITDGIDVPHVIISSLDGEQLSDSSRFSLTLSDPFGNLDHKRFRIVLGKRGMYKIFRVAGDEKIEVETRGGANGGVWFEASMDDALEGEVKFIVEFYGEARGCSCATIQ